MLGDGAARGATPDPSVLAKSTNPLPCFSSLLLSSRLFSFLLFWALLCPSLSFLYLAPLSSPTRSSSSSLLFPLCPSVSLSFTLTLGTLCTYCTALFFSVYAAPFLTHFLNVVYLATLRMLGHRLAGRGRSIFSCKAVVSLAMGSLVRCLTRMCNLNLGVRESL